MKIANIVSLNLAFGVGIPANGAGALVNFFGVVVISLVFGVTMGLVLLLLINYRVA